MKKHWISVKRGLSEDPKHRQAMGESVWLFLHIIDAADWETGMVHDWRDRDIAAEMSMSERTVRDWRQRLQNAGYIKCQQLQYSLDITIHNWTDPRDYGGRKLNAKQGNAWVSPSRFQGDTQGDTQDDTQDDTQGLRESIGDSASFIESKSTSTPTPKEVTEKQNSSPCVTAWESFISGLKSEMPKASFDAFVRDTKAIQLDGDRMIISAASEYNRDWLEARLKGTAERQLVGILNRSITVQFVTGAGG